jgi:transcription-repair coupling factor (superfamily II helicase)
MEKVMLKKGQMKCYFVAGNNERFYQSETFGRILEYVQQHPKRAILKQVKAAVMIEFADIRSAEAARVLLQEL